MTFWRLLNGALVLAIVGSALVTVMVTHRYHQLHGEMVLLEGKAYDLDAQREFHELSLHGYNEYSRVESIAQRQLGMQAPSVEKIKYINLEELSAQQSE